MMVMAIILTFVFGNAMFGGDSTQRVAVVNGDNTETTEAFLAHMDSDAYALEDMEAQDAEDLVAKGEILTAIIIPEGFGDSLKGGDAELTVVQTAQSTDIMALESTIETAANQTAHIYTVYEALEETLASGDIAVPSISDVEEMYDVQMGDNAAVKVSVSVVGTDAYDEQFASNIHYLMGYNIMFVMFSIILRSAASWRIKS